MTKGNEMFLMMTKDSSSGAALVKSVLIPTWVVNGDELSLSDIATHNVDVEMGESDTYSLVLLVVLVVSVVFFSVNVVLVEDVNCVFSCV